MPGALEQDGWHAGSPEVRAGDLQAAFADPEIDAIQTMRGGYGSAQVIPLLDFDAIAETPKAFVGLSDITALHAALLVRAGLATFYGPSLTMFGDPSPSPFTADRFLRGACRRDDGPGAGGPRPSDGDLDRRRQGERSPGRRVSRRLHLHDRHRRGSPTSTARSSSSRRCNSAPIQIDRALLYLEQVGKLEGVRGIVVGELAGCEWYEYTSAPRSKTLENVLEDRLGGLGIPVLYGLPLGTRREPRHASARRRGDGRRGRADAHDRRARTPHLTLCRGLRSRGERAPWSGHVLNTQTPNRFRSVSGGGGIRTLGTP